MPTPKAAWRPFSMNSAWASLSSSRTSVETCSAAWRTKWAADCSDTSAIRLVYPRRRWVSMSLAHVKVMKRVEPLYGMADGGQECLGGGEKGQPDIARRRGRLLRHAGTGA